MNRFTLTKQNFLAFYLPIIIFLTAFLSKFFFITSRDICLDEPFTLFHSQKSVVDILLLPTKNEPNPPLFMLILHFWSKIFGLSADSVRILPLLFNSLTAVFIYLTGKKTRSVWSGILATSIFLLSSYHFYFALETRTYSLLALATVASLFYFISILKESNQRKFVIGLVIANFVLVYSHYFGLYVIFIQFLLSFLYLKEKPIFSKIWIALIATGVLFSPMFYIIVKQFIHSSKGTWVTPPSNSDYINQLMHFLNAGFVLTVALVVLVAGLVYYKRSQPEQKISKEVVVLFLWWFVPYTLMFVVSKKIPMFIDRYILFNTMGFYLFIGVLLDSLFSKNKILVYGAGLLILVSMGIKLEINSKHYYYREVNKAIQHIEKRFDKNSIVLINPYWIDLEFVYYHDKKLFCDTKNYGDSVLNQNRIYPVWDLNMAKDCLSKNKNRRVIYYQNGSIFNEAKNSIFGYLDSMYVKIENTAYPECLNVSVFEPKK